MIDCVIGGGVGVMGSVEERSFSREEKLVVEYFSLLDNVFLHVNVNDKWVWSNAHSEG